MWAKLEWRLTILMAESNYTFYVAETSQTQFASQWGKFCRFHWTLKS